MNNQVQLKLDQKGGGVFYIMEDNEELAKMEVGINAEHLTVYHTEVVEKAEGRGLAKALLAEMVNYARQNKLKVLPLCPYVHLQFRRHPQEYADVWQKQEAAK